MLPGVGSDEDRSGCLDTALSSQRFGGEERGGEGREDKGVE